MNLDDVETGGIVFGVNLEIEDGCNPHSEFCSSTNAFWLVEGGSVVASVVSDFDGITTVDGEDSCSVHSEPVSLPAAHLPHLTRFQGDDQIMDLDGMDTRDVFFEAQVDTEEGSSLRPGPVSLTHHPPLIPSHITKGGNPVTNFIPALNSAPIVDGDSGPTVRPEFVSPLVTRLILSHAFPGC